MKVYNFAGWLAVGLLFLGLNSLRWEPAPTVDPPPIYAAVDTVTYSDGRIVYKLATDTSRNSNGDLRRLPDLTNAPAGARWRVIWDTSTYDSVMLVTGDTFAMSPMDSADATALASSWGVIDPYTVSLAWHVPPGSAPDPLENVVVTAHHDTLRTAWTSVGDSVRIFSGLNAGGQEDTFYVAGNSTPHNRVVTVEGSFYSCGNAYTTQAAADYADNRCASATIDTTEPGGGGEGDYPNEPAGLTTVAYVDFTSGITAQTGACVSYASGGNQTFLTNDGTTPSGDSSVVRLRFPSGENDGGSNGRRWDCWGPTISEGGAANQYDEIYISYWMKIEGSDYQNQSNGTKVFYVAYGKTNRTNQGFLSLRGSGSQTIQSGPINMRWRNTAEYGGSDHFGGAFPIGSWAQVEYYLKVNDDGVSNGIIKTWVNDVLVVDVSDAVFLNSALDATESFWHLQVTPVYGGNDGDIRTRDDFWRFDELYISGVPS